MAPDYVEILKIGFYYLKHISAIDKMALLMICLF